MEVFSTIIVEISATVFALLPSHKNSNCEKHDDTGTKYFDRETAEHTVNHRAKFLEEKLKDLNVNVAVMSENSADSSSLKLCGGWSEICAVRMWLMQFIQTTERMQTVIDTEQLEGGARLQTAVTEHCTESSPSVGPRRSLRNRHTAKQDHNVKTVLLSTRASSKHINTKQLKQNNVQTKRSRANVPESKSGSCDKSEEVLESYADCNIVGDEANVNAIAAPITLLTSEHYPTENSVVENDGSSSILTSLVASAGETPEACSELRHQLKEPVDINESEQKSTLRELKCGSCDYATGKQRNLLMHIARTHGDRCYVCPTCNHTFAVAKDLNHHLKCHTEQYCCEHCGRTLKSKYAVKLHVARVHKGVAPRPVKRYLCTLCGKMCRNKTDYGVHRNKEHTGVRPFHCDVCNANFFSRSNLRAHRQIHADARTHECKQCGKAFKQRQGLRIHLAVHSVERRYRCDICGKAFTQHSALVRHERTHSSARPYTCRLCPATFNDYSVLRRHMLGIHKLHDTAALRQSVQAACAEARLAEQLSTVKGERSHPVSTAANTAVDSDVNSTTVSHSTEDTSAFTTAACIDILSGIPGKPDVHLGTAAGHLLAVLSSSSQDHPDSLMPLANSLPHYIFLNTGRSVDSHQPKL